MGNARTHTFEQVMVGCIIRAVQSSTKGYIISRTMALEHDAIQAQQGCAVVTAVIHFIFEVRKNRISKDGSNFRKNTVCKRIFQRFTDLVCQAFARFQGHIAHKAITHNQIDRALVNIRTFDVAVKVQVTRVSRSSQQFACFLITSLPLMSSSPMFNKPTVGLSILSSTETRAEPMTANCNK